MNQRPPSDTKADGTTVIGRGIHIRGELTGSAPIEVWGTLEGVTGTEGQFWVREGGKVSGEVADGETGLEIVWPRPLVDRAREEERRRAADPEARTPTHDAISAVNAMELARYLDAGAAPGTGGRPPPIWDPRSAATGRCSTGWPAATRTSRSSPPASRAGGNPKPSSPEASAPLRPSTAERMPRKCIARSPHPPKLPAASRCLH